jgi:hypothetical protein
VGLVTLIIPRSGVRTTPAPLAVGNAAEICFGSESWKRNYQVHAVVVLTLKLSSDLAIRELIGSVVANPSAK